MVQAILLIVLITLLRGLLRPVPVIPEETTTAPPATTAAPRLITQLIRPQERFQVQVLDPLHRTNARADSIG